MACLKSEAGIWLLAAEKRDSVSADFCILILIMAGDETIQVDPKTKAVLDKKGYTVLKKISEGSFGKVYKAVKAGENYAVKTMDLQKMEEKGLTGQFLDREIMALINVRHPNVLHVSPTSCLLGRELIHDFLVCSQVSDIFRSKGRLYIFMEFAPNGTLTHQIEKPPGYIAEKAAKRWFKQCVEALYCMHFEHGMAHRDIKTDNVLLDSKNNAKLSDFGFAREYTLTSDPATTFCGTDPYFSPELVSKRPYNPFLYDVWSMGVMLFVMLNGKFPFHWELTRKEPVKLLAEMKTCGYKKRYRPEVLARLSTEAKDIIDQMLTYDAKKRKDIKSVRSHAWFQ